VYILCQLATTADSDVLNLFTVDSQGHIAEKTEQNPFRDYNNVQSTVTKKKTLFYFHS